MVADDDNGQALHALQLQEEEQQQMTTTNHFAELAAINCKPYVEKKGNLTYLSWAWAVDQLLRRDPEASWEYADPIRFDDGTMMVVCTVTAFGKPRTMQLPVMDHRNKPIAKPDAFAVNTAMQRCLVKAIALHGLGLYIYAGEDVPRADDGENTNAEPTDKEAADALKKLDAAAEKGFAAVQRAMDELRPPLQAYLRAHHRADLASIKDAAAQADDIASAPSKAPTQEPAHAAH